MEIQDIDEIELSMPPRKGKRQHVQTTSRAKCLVSLFVLVNYCLIANVDGQLMRLDRLQSRMVQKRSDRGSPALRGLLDTLLEPTRKASSSNGWKGFVFMDPLFKVQRSPSSSASVIQSASVPSSPSFSMDSPQYETESAPIPYIMEPPVDMYQPMASNTRYSTAKRPYDDYYDDDENGEPIPRVRTRKVKSVTTTTKKPNPTPAISIGPASGGGTAIRLGKAKITFKKGSISLGPVEDHESELKKSSNIDKSTKRPYHNYGDETEANDYIGTSSRNQGSERQQSNRDSKEHLDSRPVYSEDDYGPKYAANYKTSATGYYQSYKPYHNLDTLMDKQVNPNQGHRASLNEHTSNYSPQPVYKGSSKSAVTETYLTKGDYDYEDSVVTELSSRKKIRGKRRDESVIGEDEENNEDRESTVAKLNEKREKRKKNGNSKTTKKDFETDEDESKLTTENDDELTEDIDVTTEKISSLTSTTRASRKKSSNKPKSQQNSSTSSPKVTSSRTNRNKAKAAKTTVKPDDSGSTDEKRLIKEHRASETDSVNHDDNDDEEENGENVDTKKAIVDSEDEEEDEKPSKLTTLLTTPATATTKSSESKRRKSNSRQNVRRKNNSNRSSISTPKSTMIQLDDRQSSKSNMDTVYIGNRGQTIKADQSKSKKGSIESVSILPGVETSSDRGTIVTLKMSDDPSLGVIGSSSNSRKPGTIYQIRLTSKIPTEPAIVTKIAEDNGSVDIGKDENSLNRLIKMMQDTLEDIRKSQTSLLPSTSSSSPCPPSNSQVIIEPIPTTPKPSLILSNLKTSTVKPLVDPFLNLHHGNITVVPASMGNVSDIVDMLVKTSKFMQPSTSEKTVFSSIVDKTPIIKEITSEVGDNIEDKKSGTSDNFPIDLDSNNQSINSSDRPQAEESRTKGMKQNFNQQANTDENSDQIESTRQTGSINNDNGDDVPIIVVLLPPEDDINKGTIN
ncbi:uncharacterized protein DDB_G0284459-like [Tetranychus urticae]|uniref:Uncharacterized protein n=1 Tax=Tetranychus urticae TaxID=32264 RepID=T1JRB5_TETUR|nr:uncharacterized protein DDB_G0284459-like [Tetranychus urticae]